MCVWFVIQVWVSIIEMCLISDLNVDSKLRVKRLSGSSSKHNVLTLHSETLLAKLNEDMICACVC